MPLGIGPRKPLFLQRQNNIPAAFFPLNQEPETFPLNSYVTEDASGVYITEDLSSVYVTEG